MRANRKDGVETRKRLLDAACGVFAAKGFEDASIAEICEDAGANVAAVNYHFGSKDALYVEVWRHTFETFMQACPLDGGLRERVNPGAALEDSRRELIGPHRQQTRELVRELLGPAVSNEAVLFCETSIINPCLAVNFFKERHGFLLGRERLSKQAVEDLARHITLFLPGGLRAVREAIPAVRSNAIS